MSEKKSVIIVDDEIHIGVLIKELINWDRLNMECLGIFDNSLLALDFIENNKPDIIITDIRMPQINGLELIRRTKELGGNAHFIVVSGYREFEYAHKALAYGVENYILKPVNQDELNTTLSKIKVEISENSSLTAVKNELRRTVEEKEHLIRQNAWRKIIDQRNDFELEVANELQGGFYQVWDIKLDYVNYDNRESRQDQITLDRIDQILEDSLGKFVKEILIHHKSNLHIYCLLNYIENDREVNIESTNLILSELTDYLRGFDQYIVTIGIGRTAKNIEDIRSSLKGAYRAVCNRLRYGAERVIYERDIPEYDDHVIEKVINQHRSDLMINLDSFNIEGVKAQISVMFSELINTDNLDTTCCYLIAESIGNIISEKTNEGVTPYQFKEKLVNCIQHCNRFVQLKKNMLRETERFLKKIKEEVEKRSSKPVRQAQSYIENNYREKILLEDVACIVGLNPIYFSTLFKKETGTNFSQYLVNIRLEKAKELLTSTNQTIGAIAEEVGYKDIKYFSQLFSKNVGIKPAVYRKLHL